MPTFIKNRVYIQIKAGQTANPVGVTVTNKAKANGQHLPNTGMKSEAGLLVIGVSLLSMVLASIWVRISPKRKYWGFV